MTGDGFLTGLLGRDLQGSLSPSLHNAGFRALGVSGLYQPIDFSERNLQDTDLADVLASLVRLGFAGSNVTHPFKTAIIPLLDEVSDEAAGLGAVNTVVIRDGKTIGHNTDWLGFAAQLEALSDIAGRIVGPALVLGAGGAGRAVIYVLLQKGIGPVLLRDPDQVQAQATLDHFADDSLKIASMVEASANEAALIVNASTVGMHGKGGLPLPEQCINERQMIAEVVYFPVSTPLVLLAKDRGCKVVTGDIMCLNQAITAFELMTGLTADTDTMWEHFSVLLNQVVDPTLSSETVMTANHIKNCK
jgi:shikimate dehydrogenase